MNATMALLTGIHSTQNLRHATNPLQYICYYLNYRKTSKTETNDHHHNHLVLQINLVFAYLFKLQLADQETIPLSFIKISGLYIIDIINKGENVKPEN